jgi:hypothetical protein
MEIAMKILTIVTPLILLIASIAPATTQTPDYIIYGGQKIAIVNQCLMNSYFDKHPDKRPKGEVQQTCLWRGYIATFEFQDNSLVLKDIEILIKDADYSARTDFATSLKSIINKVVPEGEFLSIDWFSGILVLGYGDIDLRNSDSEPAYSNYIVLSVKNGKLIGERKFDSEEYKNFKRK